MAGLPIIEIRSVPADQNLLTVCNRVRGKLGHPEVKDLFTHFQPLPQGKRAGRMTSICLVFRGAPGAADVAMALLRKLTYKDLGLEGEFAGTPLVLHCYNTAEPEDVPKVMQKNIEIVRASCEAHRGKPRIKKPVKTVLPVLPVATTKPVTSGVSFAAVVDPSAPVPTAPVPPARAELLEGDPALGTSRPPPPPPPVPLNLPPLLRRALETAPLIAATVVPLPPLPPRELVDIDAIHGPAFAEGARIDSVGKYLEVVLTIDGKPAIEFIDQVWTAFLGNSCCLWPSVLAFDRCPYDQAAGRRYYLERDAYKALFFVLAQAKMLPGSAASSSSGRFHCMPLPLIDVKAAVHDTWEVPRYGPLISVKGRPAVIVRLWHGGQSNLVSTYWLDASTTRLVHWWLTQSRHVDD